MVVGSVEELLKAVAEGKVVRLSAEAKAEVEKFKPPTITWKYPSGWPRQKKRLPPNSRSYWPALPESIRSTSPGERSRSSSRPRRRRANQTLWSVSARKWKYFPVPGNGAVAVERASRAGRGNPHPEDGKEIHIRDSGKPRTKLEIGQSQSPIVVGIFNDIVAGRD